MEIFEELNDLSIVRMIMALIKPYFNDDSFTLAKFILHLHKTDENLEIVLNDHINNADLIREIILVIKNGLNYSLENNAPSKKREASDTEVEIKKFKPDLESDLSSTEDFEIEVKKDKVNYLITTQEEKFEPLKQLIKMPNGSMEKNILKGSEVIQKRKQSKKPHASVARQSNNTRTKIPDPIKSEGKQLPIYYKKDEILNTINKNQITIIIGETGSGKTTQLTQYMYRYYCENSNNHFGLIGCTQPRRLAAINVAKRVAYEMNTRLGDLVGYSVRFDDMTSRHTKIKYLTDGLLVRECLNDPYLSKYSVIFLDEAHERSLNTDVLFGLIKQALRKRPDLKVVVTSATLDAEAFASYFGAPVLHIEGRTFPVEILYSKQPQSDYVESALSTILQIHINEQPGDILCFLTGQEEIDFSCDILAERIKKLKYMNMEMIVLPLYASLPAHMQALIFEPTLVSQRKVVLATNIAETSVTIPGIVYVVDSGYVKQSCYDPKLGMDSLVVTPISQAQANQRSGRAGRVAPGKAYRLFTEKAFKEELLPNAIPEIQRTNMSNTVLTLLAMGIYDLTTFDFMDKPSVKSINTAIEELFHLAAVDEEGLLTKLGQKMAELPLEPSLAKTLIISMEYGCSQEILSIVALLSVPSIWYRPKDKQGQADDRKQRFHHGDGDHLTLLRVYQEWEASKYSNDWCFQNFVQFRYLRRAKQVREQLFRYVSKMKEPLRSTKNTKLILKSIVSGYFHHVAKKEKGVYVSVMEETPMFMHPSSSLFHKQPIWVLYHELIFTSKEYMRQIIKIDPKWLVELAPHLFKQAVKQIEKIEPLFNKHRQHADEWRLSRQKRVYYNPQLFN
eukprot:NODE_197_length_13258_cov_0.852344.p2 type:complete len:847 gc:universal NODE_197_length_13258_cov_0.852344:6301-3761(-)